MKMMPPTMAGSSQAQFWQNPPWQVGKPKHRLGLKPIDITQWFMPTDESLVRHKTQLLDQAYGSVVAALPNTEVMDQALSTLDAARAIQQDYPHLIANLALVVGDDLCVLDVAQEQRLIAACVCAPSYWSINDKLGLPLWQVHGPVEGLNDKIGAHIARFIDHAPVNQPFERRNWFLHGDAQLFHLTSEQDLSPTVDDWVVRSERQTLCRLPGDLLLFTIYVGCEPLKDIWAHVQARADLLNVVQNMDSDEVKHFGGAFKQAALLNYLSSEQNNKAKHPKEPQ